MPAIQRVSRPEAFLKLADEAMTFNETNDCAVKAVALACDVPYAVAHAELKRQGRKERKGTYIFQTLKAISVLGKTATIVPLRFFVDQYPGNHKNLKGVTSHHPRRFPNAWDKNKTYLLRSRGHILTVKGGQALDWSVNKALRICDIWEIN